MIALVLSILWTSATQALDLDSLLIKSVGGPQAVETLKNLKTFRTSGKAVVNGMEGTFEQEFVAPDKYYLSVQLPGFGLVQGFDGQTAWQKDLNGRVTVMAGEEKQDMLRALYFESYRYLFSERRLGTTAYLGLDTVFGPQTYFKVAFVPYEDDTTFVYFDTATGLRAYLSNRSDQITTVTQAGDYRSIENVQIPFASKAKVLEVQFSMELMADTAVINSPIDSNIFRMPAVEASDFHFPSDQAQVTIKFDYRFGHIRVPVIINGSKKVWMILDTGSSSNLFHSPAIVDLQLPQVGTLPAMGVSGYQEAALVQTDSLQIGQLTLYKQVAGSMNLGSLARMNDDGGEFGGLLGYDFLSRFPVLVNYHDSTLIVFNPSAFTPPDSGIVVPFYLTMQVPTVDGEVDSVSGAFLVDLGNAFGLILHDSYIKKHDLEHRLVDFQDASNLLGGVGGRIGGRSAYASTFKIGEILIQSIRVLLPDSTAGVAGSSVISGIIGNLVLQNFSVLFDYPRSCLIFYKPAD